MGNAEGVFPGCTFVKETTPMAGIPWSFM